MTKQLSQRHTVRIDHFKTSLVVVTGIGQPSDATWELCRFKYGQSIFI